MCVHTSYTHTHTKRTRDTYACHTNTHHVHIHTHTYRYEMKGDEKVLLSKGWRHRAQIFLRAHFTTVNSTGRNPAQMLQNFCTAIAQHYFLDEDDMPQDYARLCKRFLASVPQVGASFRGDSLLIIVDSVEVLYVCMY